VQKDPRKVSDVSVSVRRSAIAVLLAAHEHVRNPMVVPDCPFDHKSSTPTVLPQAQAVSFCETDESRIKSAPDLPVSTVSVVGLQDAAIYVRYAC